MKNVPFPQVTGQCLETSNFCSPQPMNFPQLFFKYKHFPLHTRSASTLSSTGLRFSCLVDSITKDKTQSIANLEEGKINKVTAL